MPKRKHNNKPFPLRLLDIISTTYRGIWDMYDALLDGAAYLSLHRCLSVLLATGTRTTNQSVDTHIIYALGAWRRSKEIYIVDADLAETIIGDIDEDIVIPVDVLKNLPFSCFYVELTGNSDGDRGFFCTKDMVSGKLYFFKIKEDGFGIAMPLLMEQGITVEESIRKTLKSGNSDYDMNYHNDAVKFLKSAVKLTMYICAVNADISENATQKSITKRDSTYKQRPKDSMKEVRKWDVGYYVGKRIRLVRSESNSTENTDLRSGSHASKRPHTRRGHFHHFYVGSKKDGTRRLVLKWVDPMYINMSTGEIPARVTKISE